MSVLVLGSGCSMDVVSAGAVGEVMVITRTGMSITKVL